MLNRHTLTTLACVIAACALALSGCDEGSKAAATRVDTSPVKVHDDTHAAAFTLSDPAGKVHSLADYKGKWVVLEWTNQGCPFVKKFYNAGKMQELQKEWTDKGVAWLSICSSAEGKQGYNTAAEWPSVIAEKVIHATAVLLDADGAVGKLYGAKTTPHMFVINPEGEIVYHGGIDDKPTADAADIAGAHNYVAAALTSGMAGKPIDVTTAEPYGCGVKY